ncbi:MAG TPA: PaaI family thioesterase [Bacteriovoracaceae bacterium]|nr:PaaI family thioesterase [Bacteriovoracaceae bacterium]
MEKTGQQNLEQHLGKFSELMGLSISVENKAVIAEMTIDERHLRPGNIMNGGVSLMLIETVGSMSSFLHIDSTKKNAFGLQVSANHVSMGLPGDKLRAVAKAVHIGKSTHIWDVDITNQNDRLVCSGRITMVVVDLK